MEGGETFTLTTGADASGALLGSAGTTSTTGNDTYTAIAATTGGTFGVADVLNDVTGTDTLNLTIDTLVANSVPAAQTSGIETVNIRNVSGAAQTIDLANMAGTTAANNTLSTGATTINNVATGASVGITGNGTLTNGATVVGYAAAATGAATLNVSGGVTAGAVTITGAATTSTVVNSTGAANILGGLTTPATSKSLTINATTGLVTGALATGTETTITVSGIAASGPTATAANVVTPAVTIGAVPATTTTINASGMTAGGVGATLVAATTSFIGGTGSDVVTTATLTSVAESIINAGAGTDVLTLAAYADVNTAAKAKQYANFEIVDSAALTGTALDMALFTNSTIIGVAAGVSAAPAWSNMTAAQAANVTIYGSNATTTTLGLKDAAVNGQLDTVTLKFNDGLAATSTFTLASVVAANVETINVQATDNATISLLTGSAAMTAMNVSGAGNVSITTGALAANTNTTVNASTLTGTFTWVETLATANGMKVTGSATGVNAFTGATATTLGDWFIGGAAADTFINNVTGQATTGGDIFTGGAGVDTFVLRGNVASGVASTIYGTATRITDFTVGSGGDVLSLSTLAANYTAGTGLGNGFMTAATAVAAGSTVITTIGSGTAGAAITAGTSLVKLSNAVVESASLQTMFNAAIGTSTFAVTSATEGFFSLYDSTNSRMVVGLVDAGAGVATSVESADVVTLIGTLNMTAADYALFSASNLSLLAA